MNTDVTDYVDIDIQGTLDANGLITKYTGKEAIQNSITVWLTSFPNDCLRKPNRGGYITKLLYRPMSDATRKGIKNAIEDGFNQDYTPAATLNSITVTPDYNNKQWIISLTVYVPAIKDNVDADAIINNFA